MSFGLSGFKSGGGVRLSSHPSVFTKGSSVPAKGRPRPKGKPGKPGAAGPAAAGSGRAFTSPPPGSYDPAIDAQIGQANRGLGDLLSQYIQNYGEPGTAGGGRVNQDYQSGLATVLRGRERATTDYGTNTASLGRSYAQLGASQSQHAQAAGVASGGALAQALAKRQANQGIAQGSLDTGFGRYAQDSALRQTALGTQFSRGLEDANVQLATAGRENTQFGLDANAQKFYQANLPLPVPGAKPAAGKTPGKPGAAAPRKPAPVRAGPVTHPTPKPKGTLDLAQGLLSKPRRRGSLSLTRPSYFVKG